MHYVENASTRVLGTRRCTCKAREIALSDVPVFTPAPRPEGPLTQRGENQAVPTAFEHDEATHHAQLWHAPMTGYLGWLRANLTGPDRLALGVVLVHLVPVWWLVAGGGLYLDDLRAQAYARDQQFWAFVISSNGTHLAPGARTLDWLQARYAPLEFWPALVATLAIHLLLGLAVWLLLRELVGPRSSAVVFLAIALVSPATISAVAWFRQSLTTLLPLALVLLAAAVVVRGARLASWRWLLASVPLLCVGLLFSERALAGCALVVALAAFVPQWTDAPRTGRARARVRRALLLGLVLAVPVALYLLAYSSGPYDQGHTGRLTAADLGTLLVRSVGLGMVPGLFGGPWRWQPSGPALSAAHTPVALAALACGGLAVGLLVASRRSRRPVGAAMLVAAAYILPIELFLFVGRYAGFGQATAADVRLYADCTIVLVIALAVAFLGWRCTAAPARPAGVSGGGRALAGVLVLVVLLGTVVSWKGFADRWHTNRTTAYVEALRTGIAQDNRYGLNTAVSILPGPISDDVIPGWMQTEISTEDLVLLLNPGMDVTFNKVTVQYVNDDGHLVDGRTQLVKRFDQGDKGFCGHPVLPTDPAPLVLHASQPIPYQRDELVEVGLLVSDQTSLRLDVLDDRGVAHPVAWAKPTQLDRGPFIVRLRVPYGVRVTGLQVHQPQAGVCVTSASVVVPVAGR